MAKRKKKSNVLPIVLGIIAAFLFGMYADRFVSQNTLKLPTFFSSTKETVTAKPIIDLVKLQEEVIPSKGYVFKIHWGDLGKRMIDDGVLDEAKFTKAITGGDTLPDDLKKYLDGSDQKQIELTQQNAQFWVDLLWGLGLANKNEILDNGPMMEGGTPGNFASTGGWTIGQKQPMDIYSKSSYIVLTDSQQKKVLEIAEGVFRPCCGNSTAFPDCNHGMAALGLIELMVSQNFSKDQIYKTVLAFNSYWFPQTYLDISYHFAKAGRDYKTLSPKELLSKTFSSAMGYQVIRKEVGNVAWPALKGGGSCGA
ncbi:MAG: hypothetical protein Q8P80_01910 [Candidatus Levybacteria bacterium]|nr:hypothetical protein [Candidatus Levybacteria bacterium]